LIKPPIERPSLQELQRRFEAKFSGDSIELEDESHLHAGHAGSKGGAGHYKVTISSSQFKGLSTVNKHRLVYDCVSDLMPMRVHALTIVASTSD
jgi:BolA family transcriptional regulator, general stress-responsive regulator